MAAFRPTRETPLRLVADQAFSRAAGAPLVAGNAVLLLKDAAENYPAWLDAIAAAERTVFFEMYIVADDPIGREFLDALVARAKAGVRVRVVYDWLGCPGKILPSFWRPLVAAGGQVRVFNPPRLDSPLGWLRRNHRKSISVDGRVAFVTGLCIAETWRGDAEKGLEPWRDTGIAIHGPAVADVERGFAQVWAATGPQLANDDLADPSSLPAAGDVALRVIANAPAAGSLMRLDQLVASIARTRLWLTDAYFVPVASYVQTLCAAARDGVDVRLLLPGTSDIPIVSPFSRAGYRQLLDAGVRVFEWNGTMLHAKTAVADGRWARVGSTNLNLASFVGNYELDVAVEDAGFADVMERQYREDLTRATEIVLKRRRRRLRPRPAEPRLDRPAPPRRHRAGRAAAGAFRIGSAVGAAITRPRELGNADGKIMTAAAMVLIIIAMVGSRWPKALAYPLATIAAWFAVSFLLRSFRNWRDQRSLGG
ncbi:MAG TPA: phospholipase D-like domain-containing protein [Candidatus Polarisedimenticolaceae bacterium]|nr:phospholipase D-like domain-containing protein [Candidatus Polarisedimenticolaceae bacterium]